jgi:hypothetical protein
MLFEQAFSMFKVMSTCKEHAPYRHLEEMMEERG